MWPERELQKMTLPELEERGAVLLMYIYRREQHRELTTRYPDHLPFSLKQVRWGTIYLGLSSSSRGHSESLIHYLIPFLPPTTRYCAEVDSQPSQFSRE